MNSPANQTQRDAWNGDSGQHWATHPESRDRALVAVELALADRVGLEAGEHVLDIGCGCGTTSLDAARAVAADGRVLGVDISEPMLAVARSRLAASGLENVTFLLADAQTEPLPAGAHDVAMSRFGTMFFDDPTAAFTNIARSLRPSGRLCIATWQPLEANDWLTVPGAALLRYGTLPELGTTPGMFAQSDPARIRSVLATAGLTDIDVAPLTVALHLGDDAAAATLYVTSTGIARAVLDTIAADDRGRAIDEATAVLTDLAGPAGVDLDGRIWITTARAAG